GALAEHPIGCEMRTVARKIAVVARSYERSCQELTRAAAGHDIAQNLVVARLGNRRVDGPRAVSVKGRVDVFEELHVLADDEQMEGLRVNDFELFDALAGSGA